MRKCDSYQPNCCSCCFHSVIVINLIVVHAVSIVSVDNRINNIVKGNKSIKVVLIMETVNENVCISVRLDSSIDTKIFILDSLVRQMPILLPTQEE
ncbi:hypothetical protein BCR32DRAFT_276347 [Anaeromyces robustus]|uniref:Uncharacterized protein n=1 Tax=Anaeromyces robustus TaxID=1754192 RepID=A0A1Y1XHR4_9FUNG|nr:hypothetical protein BCR32DRAFT_276347 [Anaeromyces robustus]|eukprot:ORX85311.1 hypothetical protein BCR32DRAFT_276347 [Anaeromyces robustus]